MRVLWSLFAFLVFGCSPAFDVDPGPVRQPLGAGSDSSHDVIVVGAGPGGIAAAIQAARMGRSVVLIEPSDHIGGQLLTVTSMDETRIAAPELPTERREGIYAEFAKLVTDHYFIDYHGKPVGTCNNLDNN